MSYLCDDTMTFDTKVKEMHAIAFDRMVSGEHCMHLLTCSLVLVLVLERFLHYISCYHSSLWRCICSQYYLLLHSITSTHCMHRQLIHHTVSRCITTKEADPASINLRIFSLSS